MSCRCLAGSSTLLCNCFFAFDKFSSFSCLDTRLFTFFACILYFLLQEKLLFNAFCWFNKVRQWFTICITFFPTFRILILAFISIRRKVERFTLLRNLRPVKFSRSQILGLCRRIFACRCRFHVFVTCFVEQSFILDRLFAFDKFLSFSLLV